MFELGNSLSNLSGDFFMGLSGEVDPTKDLPPVTEGEGEKGDDEIVDCPTAKGKKVVEENVTGGKSSDVVGGKEKQDFFDDVVMCDVVVESSPSFKRDGSTMAGDVPEGSGLGVGGCRSRPKKLVPARHLGLRTREEIRRGQQIAWSGSSEDEYEVDPETGVRRQRVGFFFKTVPRPILPDFLTEDDRWKLEGCSLERRVERAERAAGLVSVCLCFIWYFMLTLGTVVCVVTVLFIFLLVGGGGVVWTHCFTIRRACAS